MGQEGGLLKMQQGAVVISKGNLVLEEVWLLLQNTDSNRDYSDNIIEINPSQMIVGSG